MAGACVAVCVRLYTAEHCLAFQKNTQIDLLSVCQRFVMSYFVFFLDKLKQKQDKHKSIKTVPMTGLVSH